MVYQTGLTMTEIDLIYKPFISEPKSMVIAPAGYGKTHCIVESLNISEGHQLILTHTNAGVASIKEKIRKIGVNTPYTVETICGFAQKFVEAFVLKNKIQKWLHQCRVNQSVMDKKMIIDETLKQQKIVYHNNHEN